MPRYASSSRGGQAASSSSPRGAREATTAIRPTRREPSATCSGSWITGDAVPADTWPMLVAAGYLRRGLTVAEVALRTRLPVPQVRAAGGGR